MPATSTLLIVTTVASAWLVGGLLRFVVDFRIKINAFALQLSAAQERLLRALFLAALVLGFCVGGLLADAWGVREVLVSGSLLAAFSLASLAINQQPRGAYFFTALLGGATGFLHTATTLAMPTAFSGFRPAPAATNLGFIVVAVGGLTAPYLLRFLVGQLGMRNALLVIALLMLIPAGGAALLAGIGGPDPTHPATLGHLLGDFRFWLTLAAVCCFYGVETSALRWGPRYLDELGLSGRARLVLWVLFWAIFLVARLVAASLHDVYQFAWLILLLALAAASLVGNLIGTYQSRSGALGFLCLGGCLGPIFPTLAGMILIGFAAEPGTALGICCAAGTLTRLAMAVATDRLLLGNRVRTAMAASMLLGLVVLLPPLVWLLGP